MAKLSVVIRDRRGSLINGSVDSAKVTSPLQGEALAIRKACGMMKELGMDRVEIESDKKLAIKLSVSELDPPWEIATIIWDIRQFREEMGVSFAWARRKANELAHLVATKALKELLPVSWVSSPPDSLFCIS